LVGLLAAGPPVVIDRYKAAKGLVGESGADQPDADIRLASFGYAADSQSVVFYARRRVEVLATADDAADFLVTPRPGFLFVPAAVWEGGLAGRVPGARAVARRFDFYRNADVLVVRNGH
jgi:hypothetical protein